ncbi:hypothetical protein HDU93_006154 [Gonapodya sp. JEL0774]|nr:hypothetical protein HDU93_006154 [Gonapodya sp. JEL0774]
MDDSSDDGEDSPIPPDKNPTPAFLRHGSALVLASAADVGFYGGYDAHVESGGCVDPSLVSSGSPMDQFPRRWSAAVSWMQLQSQSQTHSAIRQEQDSAGGHPSQDPDYFGDEDVDAPDNSLTVRASMFSNQNSSHQVPLPFLFSAAPLTEDIDSGYIDDSESGDDEGPFPEARLGIGLGAVLALDNSFSAPQSSSSSAGSALANTSTSASPSNPVPPHHSIPHAVSTTPLQCAPQLAKSKKPRKKRPRTSPPLLPSPPPPSYASPYSSSTPNNCLDPSSLTVTVIAHPPSPRPSPGTGPSRSVPRGKSSKTAADCVTGGIHGIETRRRNEAKYKGECRLGGINAVSAKRNLRHVSLKTYLLSALEVGLENIARPVTCPRPNCGHSVLLKFVDLGWANERKVVVRMGLGDEDGAENDYKPDLRLVIQTCNAVRDKKKCGGRFAKPDWWEGPTIDYSALDSRLKRNGLVEVTKRAGLVADELPAVLKKLDSGELGNAATSVPIPPQGSSAFLSAAASHTGDDSGLSGYESSQSAWTTTTVGSEVDSGAEREDEVRAMQADLVSWKVEVEGKSGVGDKAEKEVAEEEIDDGWGGEAWGGAQVMFGNVESRQQVHRTQHEHHAPHLASREHRKLQMQHLVLQAQQQIQQQQAQLQAEQDSQQQAQQHSERQIDISTHGAEMNLQSESQSSEINLETLEGQDALGMKVETVGVRQYQAMVQREMIRRMREQQEEVRVHAERLQNEIRAQMEVQLLQQQADARVQQQILTATSMVSGGIGQGVRNGETLTYGQSAIGIHAEDLQSPVAVRRTRSLPQLDVDPVAGRADACPASDDIESTIASSSAHSSHVNLRRSASNASKNPISTTGASVPTKSINRGGNHSTASPFASLVDGPAGGFSISAMADPRQQHSIVPVIAPQHFVTNLGVGVAVNPIHHHGHQHAHPHLHPHPHPHPYPHPHVHHPYFHPTFHPSPLAHSLDEPSAPASHISPGGLKSRHSRSSSRAPLTLLVPTPGNANGNGGSSGAVSPSPRTGSPASASSGGFGILPSPLTRQASPQLQGHAINAFTQSLGHQPQVAHGMYLNVHQHSLPVANSHQSHQNNQLHQPHQPHLHMPVPVTVPRSLSAASSSTSSVGSEHESASGPASPSSSIGSSFVSQWQAALQIGEWSPVLAPATLPQPLSPINPVYLGGAGSPSPGLHQNVPVNGLSPSLVATSDVDLAEFLRILNPEELRAALHLGDGGNGPERTLSAAYMDLFGVDPSSVGGKRTVKQEDDMAIDPELTEAVAATLAGVTGVDYSETADHNFDGFSIEGGDNQFFDSSSMVNIEPREVSCGQSSPFDVEAGESGRPASENEEEARMEEERFEWSYDMEGVETLLI